MSILVKAFLFVACFPSSVSSSCDSAAVTAAMMPCITSLGAGGGSECDMWNSAVCCLKDQFVSCPNLASQVDSTMSMMKTTMGTMGHPGIASCADPTCTGGGSPNPSPAPTPAAPTPKAIKTMLSFANNIDPTTFDLDTYKQAVKDKTASTEAVVAQIKSWAVVLKYTVPDTVTDAQLKSAVATAMSIAENLVTILTGGRRLTADGRFLSTADKEVSISATDAAQAKTFKTESSKAATTTSLTSTLGGDVTVKTQPVAKAEIETTVTSTKSAADLETDLKSNDVATAAKATIASVSLGGSPMESSKAALNSGMTAVTSVALAMAAALA